MRWLTEGGVGLVLAQEQVAPGRHADIVDEVEQLGVVQFGEELEPAGLGGFARLAFQRGGHVTHDLAEPSASAGGAGEVDLAGAEVDALAAREDRRAHRAAAQPEVVDIGVDAVEIDPAHVSGAAFRKVGRGPVAGVEPGRR